MPGAKTKEDAQDEVEAFQNALQEIGEDELAQQIQAEVVDGEVRITAGGASVDESSSLSARLVVNLIGDTRNRIAVQLTEVNLSGFGGARTNSRGPGGAIAIEINLKQVAETRVPGRFTAGRFAGFTGPIGVSPGTALVHELGHAAGYVDKGRFADTGSDAVFYENQHRKLLTTTWTHTERTRH